MVFDADEFTIDNNLIVEGDIICGKDSSLLVEGKVVWGCDCFISNFKGNRIKETLLLKDGQTIKVTKSCFVGGVISFDAENCRVVAGPCV